MRKSKSGWKVRNVAVEQRCGAVPLHKHGGMPRPAVHPDVVDLEMEIGLDAAEALKPAAQRFFVVALTTKRVGARTALALSAGSNLAVRSQG